MSGLLCLCFLTTLAFAASSSPPSSQSAAPASAPTSPNPGYLACSEPLPTPPHALCPSNATCSSLGPSCLSCTCPTDCDYGQQAQAKCQVHPDVQCIGTPAERIFYVPFRCQYCFQSDGADDYECEENYACDSVAPPGQRHYTANCTVRSDLLCLGRRQFLRRQQCNWTAGCRWSTVFILSLTLGGFGADRFYLGHWQEGIGKMFSFGGLGVWTLVDVVMVAIRYVGPADGSLYTQQ